MVEYILNNGMKLIYKNASSELTSMSISIDAGAACDGEYLGIAHATEHMVYKGSKKRTENEINKDLSNVFGFQNAMTNYPYVIYYGTLLNEDFEHGIEIFSDIILNPTFKVDGFKEEMDVIIEELKEWDEEIEQYCEDKLFLNAFKSRRIKYPIIGTQESLKSITLDKIKSFHEEYYYPGNMTIAIVSSLEFENIKNIVEEYFGQCSEKNYITESKAIYEETKVETYTSYKSGINTCKVEIIFSINTLNNYEIKALRIFNEIFGEGVNSILYKKLRTENGFVYDVITKIAYEKHIKLYKIIFSTSEENLNSSLKLIEECI
ncbi:MAG: M16 family metallopeptidase, partial [Clostridium sp.]